MPALWSFLNRLGPQSTSHSASFPKASGNRNRRSPFQPIVLSRHPRSFYTIAWPYNPRPCSYTGHYSHSNSYSKVPRSYHIANSSCRLYCRDLLVTWYPWFLPVAGPGPCSYPEHSSHSVGLAQYSKLDMCTRTMPWPWTCWILQSSQARVFVCQCRWWHDRVSILFILTHYFICRTWGCIGRY